MELTNYDLASNVYFGSLSLRLIVKQSWKIRHQQCILEGARKWGSWGTIFLFSASLVQILRVREDINKWHSKLCWLFMDALLIVSTIVALIDFYTDSEENMYPSCSLWVVSAINIYIYSGKKWYYNLEYWITLIAVFAI